MLMLSHTLVVLVAVQCIYGDKCGLINSFYKDMGCKPVTSERSDCPVEYKCSHLSPKPKKQCFFMGKYYSVSKRIPKDVTHKLCMFGCICRNNGEIECAQFDCPEHFWVELPKDCYLSYGRSCCPERVVCKNNSTISCSVEGETYIEGVAFSPKSNPCLECVCQKGFQGKLLPPFCKEVKCAVEKKHLKNFLKNCAPMYGKTQCCTRKFKCPGPNERFIRGPKSNVTAFFCKYGKQILRTGDKIQMNSSSVTCECVTPPLLTCTSDKEYEWEN